MAAVVSGRWGEKPEDDLLAEENARSRGESGRKGARMEAITMKRRTERKM